MLDPSLVDAVAALLARPRTLSSQTERHLRSRMVEAEAPLEQLMADPDGRLEAFEAETLFGPTLAPSLAERADLSAALARAPARPEDVPSLVGALVERGLHCQVELPDGRTVPLKLTETLVARYLRLQAVESMADPGAVAQIRRSLPGRLGDVALALVRERRLRLGDRPARFASLLESLAARRTLDEDLLLTFAELAGNVRDLSPPGIRAGLEAEIERTQQALRVAAGPRDYLSPTADERRGDTEGAPGEGARFAGSASRLQRLQELQMLFAN